MAFDPTAAVRRTYKVEQVPADLVKSSGGRTQQILWIGCSDSWVTETETLNVHPEEIFVHRNLGNIISNGDLSSTSALAYCVDMLKVKHIVVCGHYDCGLIKDDSGPDAIHGWHRNWSNLHQANEQYMDAAEGKMSENERNKHLEEVWVLAECDWLRKQDIVKRAIEERGLKIHALVFEKASNSCVMLV